MLKTFFRNMSVADIKRVAWFLSIGFTLYILSSYLLNLFHEDLGYSVLKANIFQSVITYTLQFTLNALITWRDRDATLKANILRIAKYIPIKVVLWTVHQIVFNLLGLLPIHIQVANAITVLAIMGINYFVFDRLIFTK